MQKNIFIIYGPTGSGKTHLSYGLLKNFSPLNIIKNIYSNDEITINAQGSYLNNITAINDNTPIINMDSKQIYYNLSSLTASPSYGETSLTFHYLFNFLSPWDSITVHQWKQWVDDFINNTGYDNYIMVGGSSFYLKYWLTVNNPMIDNNHYDHLINFFLKFFPWSILQKIFFINQDFIPHDNDFFRQYNFIKFFFQRYGNGIGVNYTIINGGIDFYNNNIHNIEIIIINPSVEILQKNIIHRAKQLNIIELKKEKFNLKGYNHKNFTNIIGYNDLDNFQWSKFITDTIIYGKNQKKWINYFIKHRFFNHNFICYNINLK